MKRISWWHMLALVAILGAAGCSGDTTQSTDTTATRSGVFPGEINEADFQYVLENAAGPSGPLDGPFVIRGDVKGYVDSLGALLVDLTVRNDGTIPYPEPVTLSFLQLLPEGVEILNADNGETGAGAAFEFQFENDDAMWAPGEESFPREVQFLVDPGTSIAFVARLDVAFSATGGAIGGVVWHDDNENGMMDSGEPGREGVTMMLDRVTADSVMVGGSHRETMTDADGSYRFDGLEPGHYMVDRAPNDRCRATTLSPIHVILVADTAGNVSDFLAANFGCVAGDTSGGGGEDHGNYAAVNGVWHGSIGALVAKGIDYEDCEGEIDTTGTDPDSLMAALWRSGDRDCAGDRDGDDDCDDRDDDPLCSSGKIRGPVTAVDYDAGTVEIMGSLFLVDTDNDPSNKAIDLEDVEVGDRLDARAFVLGEDRIILRLRKWYGRTEQVHGAIHERSDAGKGLVELRVLGVRVLVATDKDD